MVDPDEQDGNPHDDYSGVEPDFTEDDEEYCEELLNSGAMDDYNAECL